MRWLKRLATLLGALLLLGSLWIAGGNAYASWREKKEEKTWAETLVPFDEIGRRHPQTRTNDAARHVEAAAAMLGIKLGGPRSRSVVNPIDLQAYEAIKGEMDEFLRSQVEKAEATIDPPPEKTRSFFVSRAAALDRLDEILRK